MSALASMLENEGLTVNWEPPIEQRSEARSIAIVELTIAAVATESLKASARATVKKFKRHFPGAVDVDLGQDDDPE